MVDRLRPLRLGRGGMDRRTPGSRRSGGPFPRRNVTQTARTFTWRPAAKPGRAKGGDAPGLRATWTTL